MDMQALAQEVMSIFTSADGLAAQVHIHAGLACPPGCGRCCNNPAIEVYAVEFLPLAVYLHNNGKAEAFLEQISKQVDDLCPLFKPGNTAGSCTAYQHRGLICRLMGYSAMRNKHGKPKLIACGVFKETQAEYIAKAEKYLDETGAPFSTQFYDRLQYICPPLSAELLPIKTAVKTAIEYVESHAYYEGRSTD